MLNKKQQHTLFLSFLFAAGLYLFFIFFNETDKIVAVIFRLDFIDWMSVLSCAFLSYIIRFIRWNRFIQAFHHHIPVKRHFIYYLAGLALTTTPAKAGETLRSLYLIPHKVKLTQSLACFFTERLLDVVIMIFLASLVFVTFPLIEQKYIYFILSLLLTIIIVLPLLSTQYPQTILGYFIRLSKNKKLNTFLIHLINLLKSAHTLLKAKLLFQGLALGLIAWILNGLVFYLILIKVGFPLSISVALTIYAISILAGAASFIPGGIGATETVMGLLLISVNSEPHIAIAVPILSRLATLWFAVCVGLLANTYLSVNNVHPDSMNNNIKV